MIASAMFEIVTTASGFTGVKVRVSDCDRNGFPIQWLAMVDAGAPEWLARASTCFENVKDGRGKRAKAYRIFVNPYRGV